MASSLRNVAAFVPAPPLYSNDEERAIKSVTASVHTIFHPSQHLKPSVESFIHTKVSSNIDIQDDHEMTQGEAGSPSSPSTRIFSTLDPTSPSFKHFTPPTSPYPWKRMHHTPSSSTSVSTAAMTPQSTTSYTSSCLSTPSSSYTKNKSYAVTHGMGTPMYQHYHSNKNNNCNRHTFSEETPNIGYAVVSTSPTHGFPSKVTKKKPKKGSPSNQSPSNKKSTIGVMPTTNTGSPQSDDSTIRKQRVKTELCMHFVQNKTCPFGDSCTYAHGEDELQIKTLADLQRNCLIDDIEHYRTKPCFTFVAIGSCPFGRRCNAIHDPRVAGDLSCWLPLTETQGNNITTDINVEGLHQKRHHAIISANPFGEQFSIDLDGWNDLYKLVTNTSMAQKRRKNTVSEVHKLSIAIQMRGTHEWMYKYRPQHIIFQDPCMVLQRRAFRLDNDSGSSIPISMKCYLPGNPDQVLVHELAFGPDADPSVRGVALWFNIPENQIFEVAAQQAKRFRWRKASKFDDTKLDKASVFDTRERFNMIRPFDRDAFDLATKILEHRYATVKAGRLTSMDERFKSLKQLKRKSDLLEDIFKGLKRSWVSWGYPITDGRQRNDANTPIPPVDREYHPIIETKMLQHDRFEKKEDESTQAVLGFAVEGIWRSFITAIQSGDTSDPAKANQEEANRALLSSGRFPNRLSVFVRLSQGECISPNRALPHINGFTKYKKRDLSQFKATQYSLQSERCWQSLLLKQEKPDQPSEWYIVRDHFQNFSRSKKVLTILQQ